MRGILIGLGFVAGLLVAAAGQYLPPGGKAAGGPVPEGLRARYEGPQSRWPAPRVDGEARLLAALPEPEYPASNPYSARKERLGKQLFFDPRLSASGQIACASCHDPELGWADGRRYSYGHDRQRGEVSAPSILNAGYPERLFWDGRAASLEEQAVASLTNPVEMAADPDKVVARLSGIEGYRAQFRAVFGSGPIGIGKTARAIATFVRSRTMRHTPFDRFMRGDRKALDDRELWGLHLFRTKARCMNCHHGANLTDGRFHHLGTSFYGVGNYQGRYAVTGRESDYGAFRTAPLRGVAHTAPYMHNGLVPELRSVLKLYNAGWWQNAPPDQAGERAPTARLSPRIEPLGLTGAELDALERFLRALSGGPQRMAPPELPD
ncbi:cytochrome-c peroxidase [Thiohalorhabdus sp. Cl-TMA]|uniref:Cytochrome-c peroxidase n=1 Tax=Thiohalorhabdus methylotrophus TaxID=3242694 RepID=A0ABV4TUN9_9GAMM